MKKFFKGLAMLLALTLIIGTVPVAAASDKNVELYVGKSQGSKTDADGKVTKSEISNKIKFAKLFKEYDSSKDVKIKSSDKKVAKVGSESVKAIAPGTAKIKLYVNGKKVAYTKVVVKANDTKVTINGIPAEAEVGKAYAFTVDGDNGFDLTALKADKESVKIENGSVTFTEAGKFTLTGYSYESADFTDAIVSTTLEVEAGTVEPEPQTVNQTAWDSFEIVYTQDIEASGYYKGVGNWDQNGIANRVYYKVNDVVVPFSSVKASNPKADKLNVQMYGSFVPGVKYFVNIAGKELSFTAAGNGAKDVAEIVFTSTSAVVQTNDTIQYKLLNSAKIDITKTALADTNYSILFTSEDTCAFTSGDTVWFNQVGDTAVIKGVFTYYDPKDNYNAKAVEAKATFVGVAAPQAVYVGTNYTINDGSWFGYTSAANHNYKIDDAAIDNVQVVARFKLNNSDIDVRLGQELPNGKILAAKVADQHFAMMLNDDSIIGVNAGNTSIILYYVDDNYTEQVIDVLPITVQPKRVPTSISWASANSDNVGTPFLNGTDAINDKVTVKVFVVDQYGDWINDPFTLTYRDQCKTFSTFSGATSSTAGDKWNGNNVQLTAANFTTPTKNGQPVECSAVFDVRTASGLKTVVSFNIKDCVRSAQDHQLVWAERDAIDTKLTTSQYDAAKDTKMGIKRLNGNYYVGNEVFNFTDKVMDTTKNAMTEYSAAAATGASVFFAKVSYNGAGLAVEDNIGTTIASKTVWENAEYTIDLADFINYSEDNVVVLKAYTATDKLATGAYTVSFYKVTGVQKGVNYVSDIQYLGAKTLTVKDTQAIPGFVQDKQVYNTGLVNSAATALAAVKDCYTFKYLDGSKDTTDGIITKVNYKSDATETYVYSVVVTLNLKDSDDNVIAYKIIVPVGELLTRGADNYVN